MIALKTTIRIILLLPLLLPIFFATLFTTGMSCVILICEIVNWLSNKDTEFDLGLQILISPIIWIKNWIILGEI